MYLAINMKFFITLLDCNDGDIRLVSVSNPQEGRVEVCHDGVWGTVCSHGWGRQDAIVACRQLGYSKSGNYGNTAGRPIHL